MDESCLDYIYDKQYDYDDIKVAICVAEFFKDCFPDVQLDFEDIVLIESEIRRQWDIDFKNNSLSEEEIGYIQSYAMKYLKEKYQIGEN